MTLLRRFRCWLNQHEWMLVFGSYCALRIDEKDRELVIAATKHLGAPEYKQCYWCKQYSPP